jgi:uncharacterized protein DUF4082/Big-like domain-containing protein
MFSPANEDTNVGVDTKVTVSFNEAMDARTVSISTIELRGPSNAPVPAKVSYDATLFTATLTPDAPLAGEVIYRARVKGGDIKDVAGNALAADVTWTFTTGPAPLRVVLITPADGATDVPVGIAPRVTFSKAIDYDSLTDSTVMVQDSAGKPQPVKISYDPDAFTIAIAPKDLLRLQYLETYTVTLKGGANEPHIIDSTGMPLPFDYSWSFTAAPQPPMPGITLFPGSARPDNPVQDDSQPVELGMKFRSDVNGLITGMKYYRGGAEAGNMHKLNLWTGSGSLLSSVTLNQEPAVSVWMLASITPIPIQANTTYVVSYYAPQGRYAADNGYFASKGVDNGPLHGLQNGVDGPNGVFRYGLGGGFPTEASDSANYYVDVVFNDPTTSAPQVLWATPAIGQTNVWIGFKPRVTFSERIDPASLTPLTLQMIDTAGKTVPISWEVDANGFTVTITPQQQLKLEQAYTLTLKGGLDAPHVTDTTGTPLAADYVWSFTTGEPPAPPAPTQISMLGDWSTAGADFIAGRPVNHLASLLRLNYASSVVSGLRR